MARPSRFPAEFRARGVQLYRDSEGRTIAEVARELGVGAETFRKWVRQDEADRGEVPEKPTSAVDGVGAAEEGQRRATPDEILRLASSFFAQEADPATAVRFVHKHREEFGVAPLCRVLGMPVSTFYDRVGRPASARALADADLAEKIEKIWVHACLARDGIRIGCKRVERIMAENGWQGAYLRRGWKVTTQPGVPGTPVPDLVDRDFTAARPN
jgi:transposase-like protein